MKMNEVHFCLGPTDIYYIDKTSKILMSYHYWLTQICMTFILLWNTIEHILKMFGAFCFILLVMKMNVVHFCLDPIDFHYIDKNSKNLRISFEGEWRMTDCSFLG